MAETIPTPREIWETIVHKAGDTEYKSKIQDYLNIERYHDDEGKSKVASMKDNFGISALHMAAFHGDPEVVQLLLDHGADANAKNSLGETALDNVELSQFDETKKDETRSILREAMRK